MFEMIWALVHYPAGGSHQKMVHCSHKEMDVVYSGRLWCLNDAQVAQSVPRTPPPTLIHHHYYQPEPLRQRLSCSLHQILTRPSECLSRLITFFQSPSVRFRWSGVKCILRVLFLSDRSGTRCGLLLLEPICFRVRRVVCSEMVLCRPWL